MSSADTERSIGFVSDTRKSPHLLPAARRIGPMNSPFARGVVDAIVDKTELAMPPSVTLEKASLCT